MNTVSEQLAEIIRRFAPKSSAQVPFVAETNLAEEVGVDSPRMIDILLDIEDRFRITIDESQFQNVKTFGELQTLVTGLMGPHRNPIGAAPGANGVTESRMPEAY